MDSRRTARMAVAASIGGHALLAGGLVALLRQPDPQQHTAATIETRALVRMEFAPEVDVPPESPIIVQPDPPPPVPPPDPPPTPIEPEPDGPNRAQVIVVPQPLPRELLALLKRSEPKAQSPIQPVAATVPKGPAWAETGSPIHGALDARQVIVYVLDASGSMGEWGKFDAARGALIATLKLQPAEVRFQVVVYSGTAFTPLRSAPGVCRPANAENLARIIDALAALPAPAGRSQHVEGLRTALTYRPDLVVLFSDADDLPLGPIRGLLKQADRPATLCFSKVTATGASNPVEVK